MSETHRPGWDKPLDPALYTLDEEEKAFMKAATGIQDDEELKTHVLAVQTKAFASWFSNRLRMARLPAYNAFIALGKQREGAILLDMGCCFGTEIRKAALDGWPVTGIVAVDLSKDLWDLGHELYRTSPETFPVPFLQGDILDPANLTVAPFPTSPTPLPPDGFSLGEVTSLNQLHGRVSAIFVGAFFHLFTFDGQERVARLLAGLLSPLPGSMIFGSHGGLEAKDIWSPAEGTRMHCHSPESWRELWEGIFAEAGAQVKVDAILRPRSGGITIHGTYPENAVIRPYLVWSVTRV
ncbi:hypothetical protein GSI_15321 [Ganoderma sinense ZZ0214-1]|uniref:Methyltransferase domain-containing protein n=1 Tax=Ganoderma sinense ZZ0214-1 TaxID=1077348 RepID=A0A2G8RM99_9APHY|nr:hypothetical protein GSI_15321 [Ganoderma sinense ZZ0214-1]